MLLEELKSGDTDTYFRNMFRSHMNADKIKQIVDKLRSENKLDKGKIVKGILHAIKDDGAANLFITVGEDRYPSLFLGTLKRIRRALGDDDPGEELDAIQKSLEYNTDEK